MKTVLRTLAGVLALALASALPVFAQGPAPKKKGGKRDDSGLV